MATFIGILYEPSDIDILFGSDPNLSRAPIAKVGALAPDDEIDGGTSSLGLSKSNAPGALAPDDEIKGAEGALSPTQKTETGYLISVIDRG